MILQRALFRDIDGNDFMAGKISSLIKDGVAAKPDFQSGAVCPPPLYFDRLDPQRLGGAFSRQLPLAKIANGIGQTVLCQEFRFGCIAEHRQERLVGVENLSFRITPAYSVSGVVDQRSIQRLRMPQGLSGLLQLRAQLPFVQCPANSHGQLSKVLSFNVIKSTISN